MIYPYRELTNHKQVQECCGWEFAAKLGEFDYSREMSRTRSRSICSSYIEYIIHFLDTLPLSTSVDFICRQSEAQQCTLKKRLTKPKEPWKRSWTMSLQLSVLSVLCNSDGNKSSTSLNHFIPVS